MEIFFSTIIPTINRSTLSRAVCSVLDQNCRAADTEVIVVNDSGQPLPDMDWQHSERVRVIDTNRRERSVARNTGAAIARGKYFHFLDDDDLLLPGAMDTFWRLDQQNSDVVWLYGSYQTVDNDGNFVNEFHPGLSGNILAMLVSGEGIPFQASLLQAKSFFAAGAFDPTITGVEDRDLGRRIALIGDVAYSPDLVAKIRIGRQGSTTDWDRVVKDDRWGREKALSAQQAPARLRASSITSYWHGRVSRAYLASAIWNLERKDLLTALSRIIVGFASAGLHPVKLSYWKGMSEKVNENRH